VAVKDRAWLLWCGLLLLVLAASVPLLGTLGLPREGAKAPNCRSNLKQLATGFSMYQQDYDGRFPPCASWSSVLQPYVKNDAFMRCPQDHQSWSYAFNSNLDRALISDVRSPDRVTLLFESDIHTPNACGLAKDAVFNRHDAGANWAFVDGHVHWLPVAPVFGLKEPERPGRK
jgi:prepilin-type processing-associated H-X9-DG protein